MLPFLKKKEVASPGLIVKTRTPDESTEPESEDDSAAGIESCAHALINAIHAKDTQGAAMALKDAFTILESEPHKEESISSHTYDAQNQKAAKEQE